MKLPKEGDFITIQSYKHNGNLHRTWRDTMVLKTTENAIIGVNDHTLVTESDGQLLSIFTKSIGSILSL